MMKAQDKKVAQRIYLNQKTGEIRIDDFEVPWLVKEATSYSETAGLSTVTLVLYADELEVIGS